MKIQKFNEENLQEKEYFMCIVISTSGPQVEQSGIFETQQDMDNWILNLANELLLNARKDSWEIGKNGVHENQKGNPIFIDVVDAINWIQDEKSCDFQYDSSVIYSNVKLKHGVKIARNINKYNL